MINAEIVEVSGWRLLAASGATGFRVRRVCGNWWLRLFDASNKNVGDYGPLEFAEIPAATDEAKQGGLVDLERDLGDRGR